jgi:hypothetical protein
MSEDTLDEGEPIAYLLLERGVAVLASGGEHVGTVHHVVAASEQDIFHGLVITLAGQRDQRFVAAADVAALHERGVDLKIDAEEVNALVPPGGAAPVYREDPATTKWSHWTGKLSGRGDWHRQG